MDDEFSRAADGHDVQSVVLRKLGAVRVGLSITPSVLEGSRGRLKAPSGARAHHARRRPATPAMNAP